MTTHMTKTWFDGKNIITQEIPEAEIYKPRMTNNEALKLALEALEEIALAGMSPSPEMSDIGISAWHARQAWRFIRIAAKALDPIKEALAQPTRPMQECPNYEDCKGACFQCEYFNAETGMVEYPPLPEQEPVAHTVIAGALFDFMGYLTSRKERIVLSAADDAAPAVDAIRDFATKRGLSLDDAQVREWIDALAQPEERNFCPRCGKRTADLTTIHTCTPPQENT
jgi:hypothetical protein